MKNYINSIVNAGNVTLVADFGGLPVPTFRRPWEVGCIISVPSDYQPCFQQMSEHSCAAFVPVVVTYPDGDRLCDKLFLSTITKTVRTAVGNFLRTRGTVVDRVLEFSNWDEALKYGLAGRSFVVAEDIKCEVCRPRDGALLHAHVYRFDFVN